MNETKKYNDYILKKNNVTDICDIDYRYGKGNQPIEVANIGVIDYEKYKLENNETETMSCEGFDCAKYLFKK